MENRGVYEAFRSSTKDFDAFLLKRQVVTRDTLACTNEILETRWSIEYATSEVGWGAGEMVFKDGRAYAGDERYLYVGQYQVHDGELHARIIPAYYYRESACKSRIKNGSVVTLGGKVAAPCMELMGTTVGLRPNRAVSLRLTRVAEARVREASQSRLALSEDGQALTAGARDEAKRLAYKYYRALADGF